MTLYVVDASVAAKWFLPEIHTEAALRPRHPDCRLHVPALFDLEFSNVICKKIRRQEMSIEEGHEMRRNIAKVSINRHPDKALLSDAFNLANQTFRSLYDCLYLALTLRLEARMVTADSKFHKEISRGSLSHHVLWVEDLPC